MSTIEADPSQTEPRGSSPASAAGGVEFVVDPERSGWWGRLAEALTRYELLWMLVRRDISVRYREAMLGIAWAVLVPAATLGVYWLVFEVFFERQSEDHPYVLFLFPAMLIWRYFSSSAGRAAQALVKDSALLSKVYFPRLLLPLSNVVSPLLDMAIGMVVLVIILLAYKHVPGWEVVWLPVFVGMGMLAATGMGLLLASFNAQFKDVQHFLPVLLHLWFFSSPVLYGISRVPEPIRVWYSFNPMVTVCEGTRYAVLGGVFPLSAGEVAAGLGTTAAMVVAGFFAFMRTEQTITDVL